MAAQGLVPAENQNAEPIEDISRVVERWGELLKPHQDASGQIKQPRWAKCWEMWQELARVIHQNHWEVVFQLC